MRKSTLIIFLVLSIGSLFGFIYFKGYEGMFDSFKKEQPDTTKIEIVEQSTLIPIIQESSIDTIEIYRVIVGSFKVEENANKFSESIPFSDIIMKNGYYMVSKSYYFNIEDAINDFFDCKNGTWILKDFIFLEK